MSRTPSETSSVADHADIYDFLAFISAERGRSVQTRDAYENDLRGFADFCAVQGLAIRTVGYLGLRKYLAFLRTRELAPRTIARKVSSLKQFYLFLLREDRIQTDPAELLSVLVKEKTLPKHLNHREVAQLLEAAVGDGDFSTRDRAILEFWYATGCRVSELVSLRSSDMDWETGFAKLRGKGSKERLVPLHTEALEWCDRYAAFRHRLVLTHDAIECDAFFLTDQARPFTRQRLWKTVKRYAELAKIERPVWPHMLRHSFATHVLQGGADLRVVQEMLGHRSIATTEIYTHLDPEDLKLVQQKFHPRS